MGRTEDDAEEDSDGNTLDTFDIHFNVLVKEGDFQKLFENPNDVL